MAYGEWSRDGYAQDELNHEESEQNEVVGIKKRADSKGDVMHIMMYRRPVHVCSISCAFTEI